MSEFFRNGGAGMFPVLLFGALAVAAAVLSVLRPGRRYVWLMLALGITSVTSGLLGFCIGMIGVLRYVQHVPPAEQLSMLTLGLSQSLHPLALALVLGVITGIIAAIAGLRASQRAPSSLGAA